MFHFLKHSHLCGTVSDKDFSAYLLKNIAKSLLITNSLLGAFYLSRFRNYRNSYLAIMHIPATLFGLMNALISTQFVFLTYIFDNAEFAHRFGLKDVEVHKTEAELKFYRNRLTQAEKLCLNEVLT